MVSTMTQSTLKHTLTINGKTEPLRYWAGIYKINEMSMRVRINDRDRGKKDYTDEQILFGNIDNYKLIIQGKTIGLKKACEQFDVDLNEAKMRVMNRFTGQSDECVLFGQTREGAIRTREQILQTVLECNQEFNTVYEWAKILNVDEDDIVERFNLGYTVPSELLLGKRATPETVSLARIQASKVYTALSGIKEILEEFSYENVPNRTPPKPRLIQRLGDDLRLEERDVCVRDLFQSGLPEHVVREILLSTSYADSFEKEANLSNYIPLVEETSKYITKGEAAQLLAPYDSWDKSWEKTDLQLEEDRLKQLEEEKEEEE